MRAAAIGISFIFDRIEIAGIEAAVLPTVDQTGQLAGGPALLVEIVFLDQLLEQTKLIVGIDYRVIAFQSHQFGVTAQHACADGVERPQPRHAFDRIPDMTAHTLAHFARSLVGEGDAQDFAWPRAPGCDEMCQTCGECRGLAGARPSKHQHRSFRGQYGIALGCVQLGRIGGNLRLFERAGRG